METRRFKSSKQSRHLSKFLIVFVLLLKIKLTSIGIMYMDIDSEGIGRTAGLTSASFIFGHRPKKTFISFAVTVWLK